MDLEKLQKSLKKTAKIAEKNIKKGAAIAEKNISKSANSLYHSAKETVENIDIQNMDVSQVTNLFKKKEEEENEPIRSSDMESVSVKNAIKIFYYLMACDGTMAESEEEKFHSIALALDENFPKYKDTLVEECQAQINKGIDDGDFYDVLQDGVEDALISSIHSKETSISPKLLIWNLLTLAYSDEQYADTERKLIKYIVRKMNVDKSVFLEMESSLLTVIDLQKEEAWVKTTNGTYLEIEEKVKRIEERINVIFESVQDLITL